jgi:hypothetical protein
MKTPRRLMRVLISPKAIAMAESEVARDILEHLEQEREYLEVLRDGKPRSGKVSVNCARG